MRFAQFNPIRALRTLYTYLTQRIADRRFYLWADSSAGVQVSHQVAMALSTYARCVAIIAGDMSCLDLVLNRRRGDGGKELAVGHPDWKIWNLRPAPYLTRQRFVEAQMSSVLTRGNGYSDIETAGGRLLALHPIDPRILQPLGIKDDKIIYQYDHPHGGNLYPTSDQVFHLRGFSEDGLTGVPPLRCLRNSLGLAVAQENFAGALFKNGAVPKGVLTYPGALTDDDFEAVKESWKKQSGGENQNSIAILDRGVKWDPSGLSPEDCQFLESRRFQKGEIAGWFGVPMHRLNEMDRATWGNVESLGLEYVIYTLTPWMVRFEQEVNARFYPDGDYFVEFNFDSLLRGDLAARANYYRTLFGMGVLSINEIRRREGLNPTAEVGDIHWMPLNLAPATDVLASPDQRGLLASSGTRESPALDNSALADYFRRMLPHLPGANPAGPPAEQARAFAEDALRGVLRAQGRVLAAMIEQDLGDGHDDLHRFARRADGFLRGQRQPLVEALAPLAAIAGGQEQIEAAADAEIQDAASQISARLLDRTRLRAWVAGREAAATDLVAKLFPGK
jgi:HK97 family phage portal protein